jgi:hypothetical protein
MFEILSNKLLVGVISFGMLLFSSFEGNNASFSKPNLIIEQNHYEVSTNLQNAFINDFYDIIHSGETIYIDFELNLIQDFGHEKKNKFYHSVKYNAMEKSYELYLDEKSESYIFYQYESLITHLSKIELAFENYDLDLKKIHLTASIRNLELPSLKKKYDMMMLWNFKKPILKIRIEDYKNEN